MFKSLANLFKGAPERSEPLSADDLLKKATEKQKAGELDGAISLLREAYKQIALGYTSYPVQVFLRLPLYLQQAGRSDEAWREFNILLTRGYPNQLQNSQVLPMEHSTIYDKMRLFLQRERKSDLAIRFGILSYMSWAIGLHRQKRNRELKEYLAPENIEDIVDGLLKKAKKQKLRGDLILNSPSACCGVAE